MPLLARVTIGCTLVVGAAAGGASGGVAGGGSVDSVGVGEKFTGLGYEIEVGVIIELGCGKVGGVEGVETEVLTLEEKQNLAWCTQRSENAGLGEMGIRDPTAQEEVQDDVHQLQADHASAVELGLGEIVGCRASAKGRRTWNGIAISINRVSIV
ncbi:hypothetical protein SASPL_121085 [Salvia splendens]|uniref:Secreted protein n=1 Tax=Salvia splendens TaxID=180675 RepID=A0A8X8XTP9_SALSN|nr:hypothetical protein SASPL_121085 [Salvia splendens]